jgi:hypothetical protein
VQPTDGLHRLTLFLCNLQAAECRQGAVEHCEATAARWVGVLACVLMRAAAMHGLQPSAKPSPCADHGSSWGDPQATPSPVQQLYFDTFRCVLRTTPHTLSRHPQGIVVFTYMWWSLVVAHTHAEGTQLQMVKVGCRGLAVVRLEPPVPVIPLVGQVLDQIQSGQLKHTR